MIQTLSASEAHIWDINIDTLDMSTTCLAASLSAEEHKRATALRSDRDQERYLRTRGVLRLLLSRFLNQSPAEIVLNCTPLGKPFIARTWDTPPLEFNLSHSEERVLIGITHGRRIGVDLERLREDVPCQRLAQRFFAPEEATSLQTLPEKERIPGFFHYWTIKEAVLKGLGFGLTFPLYSVRVPGFTESFALFEEEKWRILSGFTDSRFAGAVAVENGDRPTTFHLHRGLEPQPS